MNRQFLALTLSLVMVLLLVSCGDKANKNENGKKTVVATTTFVNDMVKELADDKVNIELIIPAGEDPHTYEAKPEDMKTLASGDLVLYHGLHFEGKMMDALEHSGKELARDFKPEELGQMTQDGEIIIDPHFWFDLKLYKKAFNVAAEELINLLPEDKEEIEKNRDAYLKELDELDDYVKTKIEEIPAERRYLITPHDAFSYFSRAYDIGVKAPQGVSTDSEVAISDMTETVDFIVDNEIKAIFAESTTDPARMRKLQEEVRSKGFNVKVVEGEGHELFSDSMAAEGQDCDTFSKMYKHNVDLMNENLK